MLNIKKDMVNLFNWLSTENFIPYGNSFSWKSDILWLHVVSYSMIALSYYLISFTLIYFIYKRKDLPYKGIFFLFATFIALCATTHVAGIVVLWHPIYKLKVLLKSISGIVSFLTLIVMIRIIPEALKILGPKELAALNEQLKANILEKDNIQRQLEAAYQNMEQKVAERTAELANINDKLREEVQERKKAEERFALAIQATADGVWDWDLPTGKVYGSTRLKEMLGFKKNELKDCKPLFNEYVHPEDKEILQKELQKYVSGHSEEFNILFRIFHKNGNCLMVLSRATLVCNDEGEPYRLVGAFTDVTESKKMEQELIEARNRAETYSRAKSEFLINMSHELRTPMNAIIGLSNILMSSSPLTDKQMRYIFTLHNSAHALLDLINGMLDISKIETSKVTLENISFNLEDLIRNVADMISIKAKEKGLYLKTNYAHKMPTLFYGDPARIRQIIVNIVENALKFTEVGGITIDVSGNIYTNDNKLNIEIRIKDTGIGINEKYIDSIFDKFMQADSSSSKKYVGMGLGLAICKGLTDLMNGSITVNSNVNEGSEFVITIPLEVGAFSTVEKKEDNALPIINANNNEKNNEPCILLVEDYYPNVLFVEALLESFNYKMETAYSGNEALKKIENTNFSLILMDIQMQDMDGFEVTRLIREMENKKAVLNPVPIIAMTAHAVKGYEEKCFSAGMNGYISKPFNPLELKKKIDDYLLKKEKAIAA
jgi:PAS domain S-box-containing protein